MGPELTPERAARICRMLAGQPEPPPPPTLEELLERMDDAMFEAGVPRDVMPGRSVEP